MAKFGYSEFIDAHKSTAIIIFAVSILLMFIPPILYDASLSSSAIMTFSFYVIGASIIFIPITQPLNAVLSYYIMFSIGSLIFLFSIISICILLIKHFKYKKINKTLLYLPLALYIVYVLIISILNNSTPFISFYLAIIIEVLVILYCAGFQHFPKSQTREHKPTNKERIAELERQVAELQSKEVLDTEAHTID